MVRSRSEKFRDYRLGLRAILRQLRSLGFAQYAEDTLLHQFGPQTAGFYIDVGACHPWRESNTYKLYLRGWDGLTIEPNPDAAPLFRKMRPRDTHLTIGIAAEPATLTYQRFDDAKLNSFDPEQATRMNATPRDRIDVPCLPLSEVIATHGAGRRIDLLSIDCEGLDLAALTSLDLQTTRPRVIVIEDFDQFLQNNTPGGQSEIRAALLSQDYVVVSQGLFSFLYVDARAMGEGDATGFRLDQSQIGALTR